MENNKTKKGRVVKEDGKLWLIVCPQCGEKNHVEMVDKGKCIWCGYKAQETDVLLGEDNSGGTRQILHD